MATSNTESPGGCRCGEIRYVIHGVPSPVVVCHCPDCRRSVGAQSVAWMILPKACFQLTGGMPKEHYSSPGVARAFCPSCGTAISWVGDEHPDRIDVTLGSLDDPQKFVPTRAVYRTHRLSWASEI